MTLKSKLIKTLSKLTPRFILYLLPSPRQVNDAMESSAVLKIIGRFLANVARNHSGPQILRTITLKSWPGLKMKLDISDYTQCGYYFSVPENGLENRLKKGGDIFIDIGANVGIFSLIASSKFRRVIAFEPVPEIYDKLKHNIEISSALNIEIETCCLSDKSTSDEIHINPLNFGGNSLEGFSKEYIEDSGLNGWQILKVDLEPLDKVLDQKNLEPEEKISLIKIDVEGHEESVIRGAQNTINTYLPDLFIEVGADHDKFMRIKESLPIKYHAIDPYSLQPINTKNIPFDILFTISKTS